MAKRGETRPWRMSYTWPQGTSGTQSFTSRAAAEFAAEKQAGRASGMTGLQNCTAEVTHRDQPDVILARFVGLDAAPAGKLGIVAAVAADLQAANDAGRLLVGTSVRQFVDGAIVTVTAHPSESEATAPRVTDVQSALARAGWATRPAGTQVIVEGRAATGRQTDTLRRAGEPYTDRD